MTHLTFGYKIIKSIKYKYKKNIFFFLGRSLQSIIDQVYDEECT